MRLPCPRCGNDLVRIERQLLDRLISLVVPLQRCRCRRHDCQWEGRLRMHESGPTRKSTR
jgi:hypothetical protein